MNVLSFYRFVDVPAPERLAVELRERCDANELLGTVLVAPEGINGTLAGARAAIRSTIDWLGGRLGLASPLDGRWTESKDAPFGRMRVRLKQEIVALGRPGIGPQQKSGKHVSPADWNELLSRPDLLLVDTRNRYEIDVGTFPGAIDPGTDSFRQFPEFAEQLARTHANRPLAMFCTGGIRCEKAAALMLELGFSTVYQLEGGILNYLESVPDREKRWTGECFVFDKRVAVDRDLAEGGYVQCHACRRPLSAEDLRSPDYREGVSCPGCVSELDADRALRLEERRKQVKLARERGTEHIAGSKRRT